MHFAVELALLSISVERATNVDDGRDDAVHHFDYRMLVIASVILFVGFNSLFGWIRSGTPWRQVKLLIITVIYLGRNALRVRQRLAGTRYPGVVREHGGCNSLRSVSSR